MKTTKPVKLRILFIGDSITVGDGDREARGWPSRLLAQTVTPPLKAQCYNLGIGGDRLCDVERRWRAEVQTRVAGRANCGAVIMIGVNDAIRAAATVEPLDLNAWMARFADLIDALSSHVPLFVVTPAPVHETLSRDDGASGAVVGQTLQDLTDRMIDLARSRHLPCCDLSRLIDDPAFMNDLAAQDQLHPSGIGYSRIAQTIAGEASWAAFLQQCQNATEVTDMPS